MQHIPIPLRFNPHLDHNEVIDLVGWLVFLQAATVRTVRLRQHLAEPGTIDAILAMNRTEFPGVVQLFPRMAVRSDWRDYMLACLLACRQLGRPCMAASYFCGHLQKCRSMLELFYKESLFHHLRFGSMFQSAQDPHRPFRLVLTPPSDSQPVMLPAPNSSLDVITQALLDRGHVLLKVGCPSALPSSHSLHHLPLCRGSLPRQLTSRLLSLAV